MPYRSSDDPPDTPDALYKLAHGKHYKENDEPGAEAAYREVIERFPSTPEAGYAKSQLANIETSRAPKPQVAYEPPPLTVEQQITQRFSCSRCEHKECATKRLSMSGSGLSRLFDVQNNFYLAVACQQCGLTNFYDMNLLEERGGVTSAVIDLMFG